MYWNKGVLCLTKEDINDLCGKYCSDCCHSLSQKEKIELVRFFGRAEDFLSDDCPYSSENGCTTYKFRPELCKKWSCSVIEKIRKLYDTKCIIKEDD